MSKKILFTTYATIFFLGLFACPMLQTAELDPAGERDISRLPSDPGISHKSSDLSDEEIASLHEHMQEHGNIAGWQNPHVDPQHDIISEPTVNPKDLQLVPREINRKEPNFPEEGRIVDAPTLKPSIVSEGQNKIQLEVSQTNIIKICSKIFPKIEQKINKAHDMLLEQEINRLVKKKLYSSAEIKWAQVLVTNEEAFMYIKNTLQTLLKDPATNITEITELYNQYTKIGNQIEAVEKNYTPFIAPETWNKMISIGTYVADAVLIGLVITGVYFFLKYIVATDYDTSITPP